MASEGTQRPTAVDSLDAGTLIDNRYRIVATLGRGGFATVYRAEHVHMQRVAAVKVLDSQRSLEDDGGAYAERFLREARIISSIRHPNVVTIYDFGFSGSQPYIAMELLDGHDLQQEIRRFGPLEPARAFRLFGPALDALAAGHDAGIVHKDLKPSNLFVASPNTPTERLVVLDYGVARASEAEVSNLTETGELLGTPKYLAPEYIRLQKVTPAIDVYQMALILSESICGQPATDGNPYTVMMNHCTGKLNIPHTLLNGPVGAVFRKAVAIDPDERFADGRAFNEALAPLERHFRSMSRLTGPTSLGNVDTGPIVDNTDRTPAPFAANGTLDVSQPVALGEPPEKSKRTPVYIAGAVVVLLLIAGFVGWAVSSGKSEETDTAQAAEVPAEDPEFAAQIEAAEAQASDEALGENETRLLFVSQPTGARVKIEGEEHGTTPIDVVLEIGVEVEVEILHKGYASQVTWITPEADHDPVVAALEAIEAEPTEAEAEAVDLSDFAGDGTEAGAEGAEATGDGGTAADGTEAGATGEDTGDGTGEVVAAEPKPKPKPDPRPKKEPKKPAGGYMIAP